MISVSSRLIISFHIYPIWTTILNKLFNKLDLFSPSIHFHIKHLVSDRILILCSSLSSNCVVSFSELLHNYPSSIIAISLMYNITSNTFILQYIKTFLQHKKDPSHYLVCFYNFSLSLFNYLGLFSFILIESTNRLYNSTSKYHFIMMTMTKSIV